MLIFTLYIKLTDLVMLYALIDYIIYGIKLLTKISDFRVSKNPRLMVCDVAFNLCRNKKVQVGKDQEKAQSEKDSHSKNRGGKKPN